jgi:poly(A) polymerase
LLTMTLRTPSRPGHDSTNEALRIFTEDPLRLLRILRFHSRYPKSQIAPEVLTAMKNEDVQHQIVRRLYGDESLGIVPERTAEELKKIMMGEQPEKAIGLMYEVGLLQKLLMLPEGFQPLNMDQKNKHHKMTVVNHTLKVLKNVNQLAKEFKLDDSQRMTLNFSALFHDIGKLDPRSHLERPDGTRGYFGDPNNPNSITHQQSSQEHWGRFATALKFSTDETSAIGDMVLNHMNPHDHVETSNTPTDKQLRKYIRTNPSWVFQYIHAIADASSKDENEDQTDAQRPYRENLERLKTLAPNADSFGNLAPAQELLGGQEIIAIVGLPPRPVPGMTGYINMVKELIRDQQDANPAFSKPEAIAFLQQITIQGKSGSGPLAPYFPQPV